MSLLFADGFDHYATAASTTAQVTAMTTMGWSFVGPATAALRDGPNVSSGRARNGTKSLFFSGPTTPTASSSSFGMASRSVPSTPTLGVTQSVNIVNLAPSGSITGLVRFRSATADVFRLTLTPAGNLALYVGNATLSSNGTLTATSTDAMPIGQWFVLETYAEIAGGVLIVNVNGVEVFNLTGLSFGAANFAQVAFGTVSQVTSSINGAYAPWYLDDLIVWNNDGVAPTGFLGPFAGIITLLPDADTAQADWTPSTGSEGYPMIAKTQADDSTFISSLNAGDISDFGVADLPLNAVGVHSVYVVSRMASSGSSVAVDLVSNGSSTAQAAHNITSDSYSGFFDNIPNDPDTGAPWTPAAVNLMQLRLNRTV